MPASPRLIRTIVTMAMLFACWAEGAAAQTATISGQVVDDRTGQPVTRVRISVQGGEQQADADGDGRFMVAVIPGPHTLIVSAIGYAVTTVDVTADLAATAALTIRLAEGAGAYTESVQVVGSAAGRATDTPAGAASVFGRELQTLRGAILDDPLRAVQSMPAVSATDDFYSEFAVRGSSFRHVNLTVDGISSRYLMHTVNDLVDGGSVTMVNSDTLGAVTLLPGSYPQKSGRRIGAEVDLLTRDGSRDRFHGRAGLSGTSATFLGEGPFANGRGSWLASVRRSYLDYLITRIDPSAAIAFGFTDAQGKATYDLTASQQVSFTALVGRAAFDSGDDTNDPNDTASASSHAWLTSATWRSTWGSGLALHNRVYATGIDFDNRNPADDPLDTARFNDLGWRLDASLAAAGDSLVEFGGDAQAKRGRHTRRAAPPASPSLITVGDYDEGASTASAYAQVLVPWSVMTITPGVRIDWWGMTHASTVSPWLNVGINLGERTTLRAGTGIYHQFAEFDQVFGLYGGGDQLTPERAVHADVTLERRLSGSIALQLTGYFRRETDVLWPPGGEPRMVDGRVIPGLFNPKFTNALDGDAHGAEIVIRRDASRSLSGWVGYSVGQLRYDRPAGSESFWANADQRHTLSVFVNDRITSRTSLTARYRFGSNFPVIGYLTDAPGAPVDPETGGPLYYQLTSERNTIRLPAYSRLDLRADHSFQWGSRRLVVFVDVANVLNRDNLRNTPYGVDRTGRVFEATETMMPLVPSAGFVVEF